jgi:hypothetical protein
MSKTTTKTLTEERSILNFRPKTDWGYLLMFGQAAWGAVLLAAFHGITFTTVALSTLFLVLAVIFVQE